MTRSKPDEQAGKEATGARADEAVESGMALGLGSGSTVSFFLDDLGRRLREGTLAEIVGVPTSVHTEKKARKLGIPIKLAGLGEGVDDLRDFDPAFFAAALFDNGGTVA